MTIEEAIEKEKSIAKSNHELANSYHTDFNVYMRQEGACRERAEYHEQVAEWLEELQRLKEQQPCEDCISRKDTIEWLKKVTVTDGITFKTGFKQILHDIEQMPPVTPQQKMGRWEWVQYDYNPKLGNWHCSECRSIAVKCVDKNEKGGIPLYKFCPSCGAKMVESQESEDKE